MKRDFPRSAEVVVIGSGILGASVAYNLAVAGLDVVVVERGEFCGEASGANVGLVTLSTKAPGLLLDLALTSIDLYPTLGDRLGQDVQYDRTGGIVVAMTPEELEARRALTESQRALGIDVRHVTGEEARALEPSLPATVLGGSYCPLDGVVYPFAVVGAYLAKAAELGARLVPGAEVYDIAITNYQVTAVKTARGTIQTKWVVNAAGAWSGEIGEMVGLEIPMVPVRGQVLVTEPMPQFVKHVVLGAEPSFRQTWAGNGVIGSTTEYVGHLKENTLSTIRHFARGIVEMQPRLADAQILRCWAGLRPGTADEMPILGESTRVKGFVVATGAFRNGMLYGPAIGKVIGELITREPLSINIEEARLERFAEAPATSAVVA